MIEEGVGMFRKMKKRLEDNLARIEIQRSLAECRSHLRTLEKSHDIVLGELQKALNDEEVDVKALAMTQYGLGLQEGYANGMNDGVHLSMSKYVKQLEEAGIPYELDEHYA